MEFFGLNDEWIERKATKVFVQIQQLRALGLTHQEIAKLLVQAEPGDLEDEDASPVLKAEITNRREEHGLSEQDLADRVADLGKRREQLIEDIRRIAHEEIDKVYLSPEIRNYIETNRANLVAELDFIEAKRFGRLPTRATVHNPKWGRQLPKNVGRPRKKHLR